MTGENRHLVGMRVMKTALAVFICLLVQHLFGWYGDGMMVHAVITIVVCMQQTASRSFEVGIDRMLGTSIGAAVGFVVLKFGEWFPQYYSGVYLLIVPVGMIVAAQICLLVNHKNMVGICNIVYLLLVTNFERGLESTEEYVLLRILYTGLGILIATLVNRYVAPYRQPEEDDPDMAIDGGMVAVGLDPESQPRQEAAGPVAAPEPPAEPEPSGEAGPPREHEPAAKQPAGGERKKKDRE